MNRKSLALGLLTLAGAAASASAVVTPVFGTGFEAPDYVAGQLTGQQSWLFYGSGGPPQSTVTVVNNPANAQSGNQYVQVNTSNFGGNSNSTRTTFSYHQDPVLAATLAGQVLHVHAGIRMDTNSSTRVTAAEIVIYDPSLNYIAEIGIQSPSSTDPALFVFGNEVNSIGLAGATLNAWHNYDIYFDFGTSLMHFFIDGVDYTPTLTGLGFDNSFLDFDYGETDLASTRFASPGTQTNTNMHRYDNVLIEYGDISVPAPAAASLMGLAGLIAARRRRS